MTTHNDESLKPTALALYKPPFRYERGYFYDAVDNMVADKHEDEAMRVRGLGRISYKENPEALQDLIGAMIAEALTVYWTRTEQPQPATMQDSREALSFTIDGPEHAVRVLTFKGGGCRPANSTEIALWDALASRVEHAVRDCQNCSGSGEVYNYHKDVDSLMPCAVCRGTGKISPSSNTGE